MNLLKKLFRQEESASKTSESQENPIVAFTINYNTGNDALNSGNNRTAVNFYDNAIKTWEDALQHNPNSIPEEMVAMCLTNRGTALTRLGAVNEAISSFDRSISVRPSYVMAYYGKAWVLEWDERVGPAINAWETYLQAAGNLASEREAIAYAREHLSHLKKFVSS
jgi:tetratricopeptide (TPR) repeat protein